ncbi:MAG: His-Xaa-Ser system radical maturase HxsB [Pseudomonadota bacterium]|jgi:hypothetical protein
MTQHTLSIPRANVDAERLGYLRFGAIADGVLLTNDLGRWHHLSATDFHALVGGSLGPEHAAWTTLCTKGFVRADLSLEDAAQTLRARKRFVGVGPQRHTVFLDGPSGRLDVAVGRDLLDHIMLSTSHAVEIRLVAGAHHDADLLSFLHQYGTEKNRYEGKQITWTYVHGLQALPPEADVWLIDKRVNVQTTFLGPSDLHDALAGDFGGANFETLTATVSRLRTAATAKRRGEWAVTAEVPVTASHAGRAPAVVDALRAAGITTFTLRPQLSGAHAIGVQGWTEFYADFLSAYLADVESGGTLLETRTHTWLTRALRAEPGADVDGRAPTSAGAGHLVYDSNGDIYPSLAARRTGLEGDEMFLLGRAGVLSYKDCTAHPTLKALTVASIAEALPGFQHHWATPFLGLDPTEAYGTTGDLFPRAAETAPVLADIAALTAIFTALIHAASPRLAAIVRHTA